MSESLENFLVQIPDLSAKSSGDLIDYFVYYLTTIAEEESATSAGITRCFEILHIKKYSNISSYLARHSKKNGKFIKSKTGYHLERRAQLELQKTLDSGPARQETSHLLRSLLPKLGNPTEQAYLKEAIACYEIGARRASIILTWLLTINHLYAYAFSKELESFNHALAKNTDKRIKITSVTKLDDFAEIPETKFIEFLRSANVISNDIRKILDTKLGIRNSSAHPSNVIISDVKATDFILDLIENIILKYIY
jgi:hypothetical protein